MVFNPADADKLFEGSPYKFQQLADLAKERKPLPRFPLAASIKARAKVIQKDVESDNIVAKLPGTDPKLKDEYVVLSAHMDHLGIGEPINGDRIYNGAMDNGSGSALVLDIANSLQHSQAKLKRSVLFVFVTAEEKGLLGSKYFAANPTVPKGSIVADINTDMFLPIYPLKILDGVRTRRVQPRRHGAAGRAAGRRAGAARSRAAAQLFHPQRSVQFHPPGNSVVSDERWLQAGYAGSGGTQAMADRALSRAVG